MKDAKRVTPTAMPSTVGPTGTPKLECDTRPRPSSAGLVGNGEKTKNTHHQGHSKGLHQFVTKDTETEQQKLERLDKKRKLSSIRKSLPIFASKDRLILELTANATLVIVGETGSGKTTQLPQFVYEGTCRV